MKHPLPLTCFLSPWTLSTVIAEIFVRVKMSYSSVCQLSYARNFRTATVVSDTHACVYGFRMLLNFVLSPKSTKYTKLNRVRKFVRLQYVYLFPSFSSFCFSPLEMHPSARCRHTLSWWINSSNAGCPFILTVGPNFIFLVFSLSLRQRVSGRPLRSGFPCPVGETFIKNPRDWMSLRWSFSQIMECSKCHLKTSVRNLRLIRSCCWPENDVHDRYRGTLWLFRFASHSATIEHISNNVKRRIISHYISRTPATQNVPSSFGLGNILSPSEVLQRTRTQRVFHSSRVTVSEFFMTRNEFFATRSDFFLTKAKASFSTTSRVYMSVHQAQFHMHLEHMELTFENATVWKMNAPKGHVIQKSVNELIAIGCNRHLGESWKVWRLSVFAIWSATIVHVSNNGKNTSWSDASSVSLSLPLMKTGHAQYTKRLRARYIHKKDTSGA